MAAGRYCNEIRTRSRSSRNAFFMPKIYFFWGGGASWGKISQDGIINFTNFLTGKRLSYFDKRHSLFFAFLGHRIKQEVIVGKMVPILLHNLASKVQLSLEHTFYYNLTLFITWADVIYKFQSKVISTVERNTSIR